MLRRWGLPAALLVTAALVLGVWLARRPSTPPGPGPTPFSYAPLTGPAATATAIVPPGAVGTPPAGPTPVGAGGAVGRRRFGVNVADGDPEQVRVLGLEWFITPNLQLHPPAGTIAVRFAFLNTPPAEAELRAAVQRWPGTYWLIANEPNVREQGNTDPDRYAEVLAWAAKVIRDADPTARLVGPNVLNWAHTCEGCPGFTPGRDWTLQMRTAYVARYGTEPPFDVWSLHAYDLDWSALPQGNAARQIEQIQGLRDWLDSLPGLHGRPIWITELGLLWAYPGITWREGRASPVGEYDYERVEAYLRAILGWLSDNAERLVIERWFLWVVSWQRPEPWQTVWTGIRLMDGPAPDAPINRLGRLYQELAGVR